MKESQLQSHGSVSLGLLAATIALASSPLLAATYNWDGGANNPVDGNSGTMSPSNSNWTESPYGTVSGATFTSINTAGTANGYIIGGTAGTITLGGNIEVQSLSFNTSGYLFLPNSANRSLISLNGYIGSENITIKSNTAGASVVLGSDSNTTFAGKLENGTQALSVIYGTSTRLGDITVTGANTYTGTTTLQFGNQSGLKVIIDSDSRLGTAPGSAVANGIYFNGAATSPGSTATLRFTESMPLNANRGVSIGQASSANSARASFEVDSGKSVTYDGIIARTSTNSGTAGFIKDGAGILYLGGSNTYNGATTINAGTLVFKTAASKTAGTATFAASTVAGLGVGGAGYYNSANVDSLFANTLTGFALNATTGVALDTSAGDFTYGTSLTTSRSLTKLGTNRLILTGTNNFNAAAVNVNAGTLLVNGTNSGSGAYTVASAATLGGIGSIGGAVTVDPGGFLSPGASIESLQVASADIDGTLAVEIDDSDPLKVDLLSVSGTLDIANATVDFNAVGALNAPVYVFATYATLSGAQFASVVDLPANYQLSYAYNGNQIALVEVPEPTIAGLLVGTLLWMRRRR